MSEHWLAHLHALGNQSAEQSLPNFTDAKVQTSLAHSTRTLSILNNLAVIRALGEDAKDFLQGQFSNDINQITDHHAQLNSWCSPKGRVLNVFQICKKENAYLLLMPKALAETTLKRLRMYVLRSRVTLEDISTEYACVGLTCPTSPCATSAFLSPLPSTAYEQMEIHGMSLIRQPGSIERYLIVASQDVLLQHWDNLSYHCNVLGIAGWQWLDIQSGVPELPANLVDEFVPQMLNLDQLDAVNFTKGCYPGQEIVARTKYLGKVKRRLFKAHVPDTVIPSPGTVIIASGETDQSAGQVIGAQPSPSNGVDILAVLQRDLAQTATLHLGQSSGPALTLQPLPYRIED